MPLQFADFARYYEGYELSEAQQLAHFEVFSDLMECITRLFWQDGSTANGLGITLDRDTLELLRDVESFEPIKFLFNLAADDAAGKKES